MLRCLLLVLLVGLVQVQKQLLLGDYALAVEVELDQGLVQLDNLHI